MKKLILFILLLIPINTNAYGSAYIVMDSDTKRVLEGNNIHAPYLTASISKIMTAIVVINNTDVNQIITIGDEVSKSYGSGIYVELGEKISILDLLYGLMLRSGNDAAMALAHHVGGSMEGFVLLMNETAQSIGMKNTLFLNSHGLEEKNNKGNTSTAYDMAILSSYAMQNEIYREIANTKKITVKTSHKTYIWHNKNRLLSIYEYCNGGKTGFTTLARRTLVTTATKDNINLTVVNFKDGNDFKNHRDLYEKHFKKYQNYHLIKKGDLKTKYQNSYLKNDFFMSLTEKEYQDIKINLSYIEDNVTNAIGQITVTLNNQEYFRDYIYQREVAEKLSLWQRIKRIFGFK